MWRILVCLIVSFFLALEASAAGLSIQIDPNRPLSVSMARKFIASTDGVFLGPDELAHRTADLPQYGDQTGFTGQDILDCPEPCGMFYFPGSIGNRISPTIRNLIADSQGWFWGESFTGKPLTRGWALVSFRTSRISQASHHRERLDTVGAVWVLENTPPAFFKGRFYTSDRTRGGSKVIAGRDNAGGIVIAEGARDNFVIDEGVVDLAFVRFKPVSSAHAPDLYRRDTYTHPTQRHESRKEKYQREAEESSRKKR